MVLESLEHARKRGADDPRRDRRLRHERGRRRPAPARRGRHGARDRRRARRTRRSRPPTIQYVNAHGTGTAANDDDRDRGAQARVRRACRPSSRSRRTSRWSATRWARPARWSWSRRLMAMQRRHGAADHQLSRAGPGLRSRLCAERGTRDAVDAALSNSFAFGGLNAVLAVRRVACLNGHERRR